MAAVTSGGERKKRGGKANASAKTKRRTDRHKKGGHINRQEMRPPTAEPEQPTTTVRLLAILSQIGRAE